MTGVIGAGLYKSTNQKCLMRDMISGTKDWVTRSCSLLWIEGQTLQIEKRRCCTEPLLWLNLFQFFSD